MSLSVISQGLLALTRRKESGGQPGERSEKNVLVWICLKITTDEEKHVDWIKFTFVK
jgi:hypothetical protein